MFLYTFYREFFVAYQRARSMRDGRQQSRRNFGFLGFPKTRDSFHKNPGFPRNPRTMCRNVLVLCKKCPKKNDSGLYFYTFLFSKNEHFLPWLNVRFRLSKCIYQLFKLFFVKTTSPLARIFISFLQKYLF